MTASYRIYFRNADNRIVGRDDFEAADDRLAMTVAGALCDACSDVCDSFELWQTTRRVDLVFDRRVELGPARLNAGTQELVAQHEETLRDSVWAVARSKRLLEETQRLLDELRRRC